MENNFLRHSKINPYHLSVGAVLMDAKGDVIVQYFKEAPEGAPGEYKEMHEVHQLMRETPEVGESLWETLHRGVQEEFGAKGEVLCFLGSREEPFKGDSYSIIKTTVYFLVRVSSLNIEERIDVDIESQSEIVTLPIDDCILKMKEQYERLKIPTLNESGIVVRAKEYLEKNS